MGFSLDQFHEDIVLTRFCLFFFFFVVVVVVVIVIVIVIVDKIEKV